MSELSASVTRQLCHRAVERRLGFVPAGLDPVEAVRLVVRVLAVYEAELPELAVAELNVLRCALGGDP